jgi:hypothetical protein
MARSAWRRLALVAGVVPFAAAIPLGAAAAEKLVGAIAGAAVVAGQEWADWSATAEPVALPQTAQARTIAALDGKTSGRGGSGNPAPVGVFVSRQRVLAAARAGIRPSGVPVPATKWRPAGVALVGVGGLGVGLRDGDVLVSPAGSEGAVIGAVTAAMRRGDKAIGGVAWRGMQKIIITVELPREEAALAP